MKPAVDDFVNFGNYKDKNTRDKITRFLDAKAQLDSHGNQHEITHIDKIINDPAINSVMAEFPAVEKDVEERIIHQLEDVEKQVVVDGPFVDEESEQILFQQAELQEFTLKHVEVINKIHNYISDPNDSKATFDPDFYFREYEKISTYEDNDLQLAGFQAIKNQLIQSWSIDLQLRKDKLRLELIDKMREKLIQELYTQIEKFKQMLKLIKPFSNECGRLWDLSEGNWQNIGFDILEQYSSLLEDENELQQLAKELGRMHEEEIELIEEQVKEIVIEQKYEYQRAGKSELVGVTESADINNLLPSELSLLDDELTELLFYSKLAEKKLATYQFYGTQRIYEEREEESTRTVEKKRKNQRGPIILCVDTSGSMQGTPERVAKILAFAILRIALLEDRRCYLISFSTTTRSIELTNFNKSFPDLIKFLQFSFRGGNDAAPALKEGIAQTLTKNYSQADILMISDFIMSGLDDRTNQQIIECKERGTRFHGLIIANSANTQALEHFDNNWFYNTGGNNQCKQNLKNFRVIKK